MDTSEEAGDGVLARTVVQPDGDVVCFATPRYCEDAEVRAAHRARVGAWYGKAESTVSDAVALLGNASVALGVALGALVGGMSGVAAGGLRGLVVALPATLGLSAVASALVHIGLRRLASGVLGGR